MKVHVCYRDSTSDTANRIANDLEKALDIKISRGYNPIGDGVNISWGYRGDEELVYINEPNAIKETIDKEGFNKKLESKNCQVAKTYGYKQIMWEYEEGKIALPIIARRNRVQGGSGFRMCLCKKQIAGAIRDGFEYFKEYIKPKNEFRVHIFNYKPILVTQKEYRNTECVQRNQEEEDIISEKLHPKLINIAKRAMYLTSLDFGAVDILESEDGKYYVLEINSAPALDKKMRIPYIECLIEAIREKIGKEVFAEGV